jgi:hypothetical protein
MNDDDQILEEVLARLRSSFGRSVQLIKKDSAGLTLQIGSVETAVVHLVVDDPSRPSFTVSYPVLRVKKDGSRRVLEVRADTVLIAGIEWIVGQLAQHGVVPPEFD